MSRSRRSTTKAVNYAKEQDFSDDDIFEDAHLDDSPERQPITSSSRRKSNRPRKSNVNAYPDGAAAAAFSSNGVATSTMPTGGLNTSMSEYDIPDKYRYHEKGYDTSLPHIRERFDFMPELELDGSAKVELIIGRRLIGEGNDDNDNGGSTSGAINGSNNADIEDESEDEDDEDTSPAKARRGRRKTTTPTSKKKQSKEEKRAKKAAEPVKHHLEYEYLVKYKGKSYLHLEWKAASELESLNKSAKNLYRRYLRKIQAGTDEDLEDPDFDSAYIQPQKIVDEEDHIIQVELNAEELVEWEKQQAQDDESSGDEEGEVDNKSQPKQESASNGNSNNNPSASVDMETDETPIEDIEIGEPGTLTKEQIQRILSKESPYYPKVEGYDNPYRDGYITEPPRKSRASYLFFQGVYRSVYQKNHKGASVGEIMKLLGDAWGAMSEEEQAPYIELANEEAAEYNKHKILLEKAQRPNELWQPLRRGLMIVDRLSNDSIAEIFLEPVNTDDFPDYLDYVEKLMDLGTVRQKIKDRKYMGPEQFARDMRMIWSNCKIYNQHGSAIWCVADFMSKQFERLYHAWVIEFRDRYLRWINPKARPWEHSCRECDGKCTARDEQLVLCDHCDAAYNIACLDPPLKDIPKGAWHCIDCARKIRRDPSARMLSAISEHVARKRAELGDIPKKNLTQKMFLVKWAGLGYEHCTWETKEDINDDALIETFYKENNMTPDEPDIDSKTVDESLKNVKHLNKENAGGLENIPELRCQLYSQTRAFHFAKFGMPLPPKLCAECGPLTKTNNMVAPQTDTNGVDASVGIRLKCMPPLLVGEYDTIVPITEHGLLMNVGEVNGSVAFLGYRRFPDGSKGPSEVKQVIRSSGDKIIAVDGFSTVGKTFKQVIDLLKGNGKHKCVFIRFLSFKYSNVNGDFSSMGRIGRFMAAEAENQFRRDRRHLLVKRKLDLYGTTDTPLHEEEESDGSVGGSESDESDDEASVVSYDQVSDDEDLIIRQKARSDMAKRLISMQPIDGAKKDAIETLTKSEESDAAPLPSQSTNVIDDENKASTENADDDKVPTVMKEIICHQETTQSLALRLLDINVGYSSDEGCDEDCAYFLDGVDQTFTTNDDHETSDENEQETKSEMSPMDTNNKSISIPAKRSEFDALGDRAKICAAVLLASRKPDVDAFDNYPLLSTKELEQLKKAEEEAAEKAKIELNEEVSDVPVKLSKTKVEQLSIVSNDTIRVWKSVEDAAATLQISLKDIKEVLSGVYNEDLGDEVGGYRWRFASEDAEVTKIAAVLKENDKGKKAFLEFRDKLYDHQKPHSYKNGNRLRDYQIDGVNWLASCWYKTNGCILADEMGLGKTVQIVCYIEHLSRVEKVQRPFLICVPLSTVEHWRREFEGWTDLKTCVYHDRQRVWRDVMREYEWYYADRPHTPDFLKFDVLVTTYDTLIGDFDVIGQIPWRVTVVDEAHRLRNQKGKLLECMKEISAKGTLHHGYQSRVLMTGTPLQNNIQELWTLLNFIEPYKFPSLEEFEAHYGNMGNKDQVERLQNKISPFMLRRVKEDVAKDIPAKEETLIDVELTSIQKQYYRAIFEHNHSFLNMGNVRNVAPKLMNIQMELRKCCNHPFLLDGIEHRETEKQQRELLESGQFDGKTHEEIQKMLNVKGYIDSSGKMVLLDKLLPKLRMEGHKVLIFSQMVKMLDLLAEYCDFRSFNYERLDGRVRGNERQKAIDRFETEDDSFIFMLSTRAGGVGINLTAADICIIFDSDWNPQNDVQAQARCHRIGQTKSVMIYRLITSRTFEQEMFDRASKKLGLEQAVLGSFDKGEDGKPTAHEMEQLLKKGAYALMDDDDVIAQSFVTDDIESILKKRTRTRVVEGAKTASWLNKQGMVTKSKFTSDKKSANLDMDDPHFWEKVMPNFVTPAIMKTKFEELVRETTDPGGKKKGRGRGRWKKVVEKEGEPLEEDKEQAVDDDQEETTESIKTKDDVHITRTNQKNINKFISDLKSMMDGVLEDLDDDSLPAEDKQICEQLLLKISCTTKLFSESQRILAKNLLKRLEGDRRRKCRDTGDEPGRFSKTSRFTNDPSSPTVNEKLLITSSHKRKKKRGRGSHIDEEASSKRGRKSKQISITDINSDSEVDWSDVEEDSLGILKTKKAGISKKESRRRRAWASDKDATKAAGLAWPSFPRIKLADVLGSLLDKVIKNDQLKGGLFSEPVPKDEFPEYYEMIEKPMDYGTMKEKLKKGEYRSAQAMQKDFVLIMSNCVKFNSADSEIVKEARFQILDRPKLLKEAALENKLFIAEDGSVLDVYSDNEDDAEGNGSKIPKKRGRKPGSKNVKKQKKKLVRCNQCAPCLSDDCGTCEACEDKKKFGGSGILKRSCVNRKCENLQEVIVKARRGRPPKGDKVAKASDSDASDQEEQDNKSPETIDSDPEENVDTKIQKPKQRLRLKLRTTDNPVSQGRIPKKRKQTEKVKESPPVENLSDGEIAESQPEPKQKRRKKQSMSNGSVTKEMKLPDEYRGVGSQHTDIITLKKEQENLGDEINAARTHFMKHGPWKLPDDIPQDKFTQIAKATTTTMGEHDGYKLFAEPVELSDYFDVIKKPMDFGTIMNKIEEGMYSSGSKGANELYKDFLLVMDNCALYNKGNDEVVGETARLLGLLPIAYAEACDLARA
mmetsp:Transcript_1524/g.2023  ORF Transcript_1524/g.2023 Transcript_1524/m.2023 type:complete len:2660 (+) Transcript_1524:292-8271(+)